MRGKEEGPRSPALSPLDLDIPFCMYSLYTSGPMGDCCLVCFGQKGTSLLHVWFLS